MTLELTDFRSRPGQHCETSTLGMMLAHEGLNLTEAMLLGLGEGLDFAAWSSPEPRRIMPILSGRIHAGGITDHLRRNLGVDIVVQSADTPELARRHVEEVLGQNKVAGLKLDIYYLDYFKSQRHFAAHYVAMHGMDDGRAFVVDTAQQGGEHRIPLDSLARARDSREGLQPSRNLSMYVAGVPEALRAAGVPERVLAGAIQRCMSHFLSERGEDYGPAGMTKTARAMATWDTAFDEPRVTVSAIAHFWRFAGTGGANFRKLYLQFLEECSARLERRELAEAIAFYRDIVALWDAVIDDLMAFGRGGGRILLEESSRRFAKLTELERQAAARLLGIDRSTPSSWASGRHGERGDLGGGETSEAKTVCRMCHGGCGAIVTLEHGVPVGIRGDAASPVSEGFFCVKGKASLELLSSPHRLTTPLRKVERDGQEQLEPCTWSDALDAIAARLRESIRTHGAESIVLAQGTDRNYQEWVFRFANALGTPNVVGPAHVCFYPRVMSSIMTFGGFTFSDYEGDPQTIVLWGSNKLHTHSDGVIGIKLAKAIKRGARLIVIDPYRTTQASQADRWLQIRPGSDGALALGMLHLVIENGWYDREFVAQHTSGFEQLREHVRAYDLDTVCRLTGLDGQQVYEATKAYATSERATIEAGTGISQNRNSFDTLRAVYMLSSICGFLDAEGGDLMWDPMPVDGRRSFPLTELLPESQRAKRLGGDKHRVLSMSGWAHPDAVWDAILTAEPYSVRSLVVFGSNPLVSQADTPRIHRALQQVDFLVVCDLFLTPTARLADLVLPASSWLERDQIVEFNAYVAARRKLAQVGQSKSDEEIILELAARLGLAQHFWPSVKDALDHKLSGLGHDWESFKSIGFVANAKRPGKHQDKPFRTPSGRVNLYHPGLEKMGYPPLPVYVPSNETPAARRALPYVLTSGHSKYFYNTEYLQLDGLRRRQREPHLTVHPETAEREGLCDGDRVVVRGERGRLGVEFDLRVSTDILPDVLYADPCWWYPESDDLADALGSNVNALTTSLDVNPQMGSNNLRGLRVALSKRESGQSSGLTL